MTNNEMLLATSGLDTTSIENHMVINTPDCGDITQKEINNMFEQIFNDGNLPNKQEVFVAWAETYDESCEIFLGTTAQQQKVEQNFWEYAIKKLYDEFSAQTGYQASYDFIKNLIKKWWV